MDIIVTTAESGDQRLEVNLETEILEIKNRLEQVTKIPVDSQVLYCYHVGQPPSDQTLNELGIRSNAVLELRDKDVIDITLRTFEYGKETLTVNRRMEFSELQRKFQVLTQIPVDFQLVCQELENLVPFKTKTLREVRNNAQFVLYDRREITEVSAITPEHERKWLILNPGTNILKLQTILELETNIPVRSQTLFQNGVNLSGSHETFGHLGISSGAEFQVYDEKSLIRISVTTPNNGKLRLATNNTTTIVRLQDFLEQRTQIAVEYQMLFHKKINLSLSGQTLLQLGIPPKVELTLFDKCTIFKIKLHIIYNDEVKEYNLVPQQTIKLLIQAVQLTWPEKHLCDKSAITFVCRPNPDGSPGKYENAIDVETTFAELQVKQGDTFCVGIISLEAIKLGQQ